MALQRPRFYLVSLLALLAFSRLDAADPAALDLPRPAPPGDVFDDDDDDDEHEDPEREAEEEAEEEEKEMRARGAWLTRRLAHPAARIPKDARARAVRAHRDLRRAPVRTRDHAPPAPTPPEPPGAPDPAKAIWSSLGPAPVAVSKGALVPPNMGPQAGRASAIVIDPIDSNILYAGYALGGVWKSTDAGKSWTPLTDTMPSLAVGSLVIDPASPNTIWLGTGESAIYAGYGGEGLFRSTDAGKTWSKVGGDQFDGLSIARVALDGQDLYLATTFASAGRGSACTNTDVGAEGQGLYRSSDGGKTFTLLKVGAMVDVEIDTSVTPRRIFASDFRTGAFRSTDGGETWTAPAGLPTQDEGATRIEIAIADSDPSIVYAGLGHGDHSTVFRSTDHGATFTEIPGAPSYCQTQCHYDNSVIVDPTNPDTVWLGGALCAVWKTTNATAPEPTWVNVSLPNHDCGKNYAKWSLGYVHPDVQSLAIDPNDPDVFYAATDGGLARTTDGGETWERLNDGVGTLQLYGICVDPSDPNIVYGGSQDNGAMKREGDKPAWRALISGDGGPCAIDPQNPETVLITTQGAHVFRSSNGFSTGPTMVFSAEGDCASTDPGCGDRAPFIAPLVADPVSAGTFYVGTHRLWKSAEGGTKKSWKVISDDLTAGPASVSCGGGFGKADDVLSAIAVAPSAPDTVYTGSEGGVLSVTTDGGATWTRASKAPLPDRYLSSLAVDPIDAKHVYAAFSGFDENTPETPGHIFSSLDGGATWTKLDIGLDIPVNALAAHPVATGLVYAGTDLGVLVTTDGGASWAVLGDDLPNTAVFSLQFHRGGQKLLAGTFGRSAWATTFEPGALGASPATLTFSAVAGASVAPAGQAVRIVNDEIHGSIVAFGALASAPWITVSPDSGAAAGARGAELTVQVNASKMEVGAYDGEVIVTPTGGGEAVKIPVHMTVTAPVSPSPTDEEAGCGCRVAGGASAHGPFIAALGLALTALARRRKHD